MGKLLGSFWTPNGHLLFVIHRCRSEEQGASNKIASNDRSWSSPSDCRLAPDFDDTLLLWREVFLYNDAQAPATGVGDFIADQSSLHRPNAIASCSDFPPGAAQRSSTCSPG